MTGARGRERAACRVRRGIVLLLTGLGLQLSAAATAATFTVEGRFLYEDRIWDQFGYTGAVQNLPIRHADVEVVKTSGGTTVIATGSTDANGDYSIQVTGETGTIDLYVRCLSSTDNATDYHIKVVDTFARSGGTVNLSGSTVHAITTGTVGHNTSNPLLVMGDYLIQDTTGFGVAQAYNIMDNAVDAFDYLETAAGIGRFPTAGEFVVYGWDPPGGSQGSNYGWQGIFITAYQAGSDTDGWSDTVILHETGHWASDMFGKDHNPGGPHTLGDNDQDPRLSYGEGYATFFCAQVREFRAPRLNELSQPIDDHISFYADLAVPPTVGNPGGLEFSYDFETGLFGDGGPLGQVGSANETNITSAMWDLVDGPTVPDETPTTDDEPGDETGSLTWDVIQSYMTTLSAPANWITVEDFYAGWFATHGGGFMQTEVDSAFIGLGKMPFYADAFEPNDDIASAGTATVLHYAAVGGRGIVINECDLGVPDRVELFNPDTVAVDMTGWVLDTDRNGYTTASYTFPSFTLHPGCFVIVHDGGSAANNDAVHLYAEGVNFQWFNGDDGSCTIEDDMGTALDFVRWDNVSGSDSSATPIPPGQIWTGSVFSPPGGKTLGRDKDGTDTDDGSDWSSVDPSLGSPNFVSVPFHTIYPAGDIDVVRIDASPGDLLVVQAESPHSAGEPRLELLDPLGTVLGDESATYGIASFAELQFLVDQDTTFYARVTHIGPYTDYAPINLLVYQRPVENILSPPVAVTGVALNVADVGDTVQLGWLNGGVYDELRVFRDGAPRDTLSGGATSYTDVADRGVYQYGVKGVIGGQETDLATTANPIFAGLVGCYLDDGLEVDTSNFDLDLPWARTSSLAASGSWSLTDSPGTEYFNQTNLSAVVVVPTRLDIVSYLEFDHICITEATYDFGYVEISTDLGESWTQLAKYDEDDHPGWSDHIADPGDWVHEAILLDDYLGEEVLIRFRLETDQYVREDGWYIDNVKLSENVCENVVGVPEEEPVVPDLLVLAGPNPFSSRLRFSLTGPAGRPARAQVFDAQGRLVSTVFDGVLSGDRLDLVWDGRNRAGQKTAAGFYLLRAVTGDRSQVRRVVKLD